MANSSRAALFLVFNILLFTVVSSSTHSPPPPPSKTHSKTPSKTNSSTSKCTMDMVRLGVCLNVLNGLVDVKVGRPTREECCSVIDHVLALDVAACVCLNVGVGLLYNIVKVDIPLKVNVLLNTCRRDKGDRVPKKYQCASS